MMERSAIEVVKEEVYGDDEVEACPSGVVPLPVIRLPDGAVAVRREDALEVRDAGGRLLVRYENGCAEIAAPAGDLLLAAPAGRVVMRAGTDVAVEAARRVSLGAGPVEGAHQWTIEPNRTHVITERLEVQAKASQLITGKATLVAQHITTTARRVALSVDHYELVATRIVETARDAFREVADLAQTKVGRARTLVRGAFSLRARRAHVISKEETKVDGKKVLLG